MTDDCASSIRHRAAAAVRRRSSPGNSIVAPRVFCIAIVAICTLVHGRARAGDLAGSVSLASRLVDRGLAITPPTPVVQGNIAWTTPSGWSLGVSGGVELRAPGRLAESVVQIGYARSLSDDWRMQTGLVYYHYAGRLHANVYEPSVYWIYRDALTFGVSLEHVLGTNGRTLHPAADLDFRWPLAGDFSFSGGVGVARYAVPYGSPGNEHYRTGYYRYGQAGLLWRHGAWQAELDRVAIDSGSRTLRYYAASPWLVILARSF